MLVGERMSSPVITVKENLPIVDALELLKREQIRRAPVLEDKKLIGIITMEDLLNASPSQATSLSIWELNYLVSKITVKDVMTHEVHCVSESTSIEEAALTMIDNKVSGLPVLRDGQVVGMITETDLFKIFLELMEVRKSGVRVTVEVDDHPGLLADLTNAIAGIGGNILALGTFTGESPTTRTLTIKINGIDEDQVVEAIDPIVHHIIDIRTMTIQD